MNTEYSSRRSLLYLILFFSTVKLLIHLYANTFASYGIFRDEFYYIACSNHLAAGYVDQPPFSIFILSLSRAIFGESLFALRLLPSVMAALTVFVTGLIVKEMNGGKAAVVIACSAVIAAPIILGMNTIFSMNTFDHLFWALAAYIILLIIKNDTTKYWVLLGVVFGFALLNKIGISWFIFGFYAALLLTDKRKKFFTADPYITGIIALLLFSPFIIWNFLNDFAHIEFIRNATLYKYAGLTWLSFLLDQFILPNPVSVFVWLPGLYFLFFNKDGKQFKVLGIIFLSVFLILLLNGKSKGEYLSPAYVMLFAAGGVFLEQLSIKKYLRWIRYALPLLILLIGGALAPLAIPLMSAESFIKYQRTIGLAPSTNEGLELNELPQFYADMFGWEEMARTVSKVYMSLPESEKNSAVIFAQNYGEAGSLQYFSKKYPLPPVICVHNNYWIWGYPKSNFKTVIVIGGELEEHKGSCNRVEQAAVVKSKYAIPYENNLPIYICRDLKITLSEIWKQQKHFM